MATETVTHACGHTVDYSFTRRTGPGSRAWQCARWALQPCPDCRVEILRAKYQTQKAEALTAAESGAEADWPAITGAVSEKQRAFALTRRHQWIEATAKSLGPAAAELGRFVTSTRAWIDESPHDRRFSAMLYKAAIEADGDEALARAVWSVVARDMASGRRDLADSLRYAANLIAGNVGTPSPATWNVLLLALDDRAVTAGMREVAAACEAAGRPQPRSPDEELETVSVETNDALTALQTKERALAEAVVRSRTVLARFAALHAGAPPMDEDSDGYWTKRRTTMIDEAVKALPLAVLERSIELESVRQAVRVLASLRGRDTLKTFERLAPQDRIASAANMAGLTRIVGEKSAAVMTQRASALAATQSNEERVS